MAITKSYKVHSAVNGDVEAKAMIGNREVVAKIPGLIVELTENGGTQGHTFPFFPESDAALAEAQALFEVGANITLTFTQG